MNELLLRRRKMAEKKDEKPYFRVTSLEDGSSVAFGVRAGSPNARPMDYRKNGGAWAEYTVEDVISIYEGEYVEFRRRGNAISQLNTATNAGYKFKMTGKTALSGNIMSLVDATLKTTNVTSYSLNCLFYQETSIITAEDLELPAITRNGYGYVYYCMFYGCTSLVYPPKAINLQTTSLRDCASMFYGCTSLLKAMKVFTTTVTGSESFGQMYRGCTSLVDGGDELPATSVSSYAGMFQGCTKLEKAPYVKATTLSSDCFNNMFRGGANKVKGYHFATLNTSYLIFVNGGSPQSLTIDAVTPPTIGNQTISGLNSNCIVYVPDESVQAYKEAQYWSVRADYIKGMSNIWQAYIQDGLVLHLDAKKVGETEGKWTDLISGRELTASNVVFNSDHVLFNGTNSSVSFNPTVDPTYASPFANNACTIECVFEDTSDGTSNRCIYMPNSTGQGAIYLSGDKILTGTTGDSMGDYARVAKGSISISKSSGFWNGEALTKLSTNTTVSSYYAQAVYIGKAFNSAVFQGKLSSIRIYNRVLTRAEVYNNYQIDKIRFPLLFV